ncbi:MAG TPA: S1 RNA-binding domain-containing protein, partial [Acidimicrobiales bacterium]|nr:S1 RNA-binding domain-containing protein [Acidimicrobiales bacterium]
MRHVVVDGSNIATETRSLPSLRQLDEAVQAWLEENPDDKITVVVDATFGHRIAESERAEFDAARDAGEVISPPAGAIGRGDAFVLRVAEKIGAVVLSNDSFQEFHGEHEWLFDQGRLFGGTPVAGVGWIFMPRTPVRGPKSRVAVRDAKRDKARIGSPEASGPMPVPKEPPPARKRKTKADVVVEKAVAVAIDEVEHPHDGQGDGDGKGKKRRGRSRSKKGPSSQPAEPVNVPMAFIQFITEHNLGDSLEGEVEEFSSHGAFVRVGDARCYIPLSAMGDPRPNSAREVMRKGEIRTFVLQALDAPRRGIELALPGF